MRLRVALKVMRSLPLPTRWATRSFVVRMDAPAWLVAANLPSFQAAARIACKRIERDTARVLARSGTRARTMRRRMEALRA